MAATCCRCKHVGLFSLTYRLHINGKKREKIIKQEEEEAKKKKQ
jgi:hypothetical protein